MRLYKKIQVDDCAIVSGIRCDKLLLLNDEREERYIELKGTDVMYAIDQLRTTMVRFCQMVKISIITATFNSAKTVRDTLDSVLRQDYGNFELIIKDGGSSDDTLAICEEYAIRFEKKKKENFEAGLCDGPVMHIISCPDKGIYDAMNHGIAAAEGDVVGVLNSDDFYTSPDILKIVAQSFERYPDIDAVYGDVHYVKEIDTTRLVRYYSCRRFRRWWMRMGFMVAHPSFYCRKSVYEKFQVPKDLVSSGLEQVNSKWKVTDFKEPFYFNPSYKIAADFENLLRLVFVNRIKTRYICRDFVTMRTGGTSSSGMASHRQIIRDHMRAFKENSVYSNYLLISLRYLYKIVELTLGCIRK